MVDVTVYSDYSTDCQPGGLLDTALSLGGVVSWSGADGDTATAKGDRSGAVAPERREAAGGLSLINKVPAVQVVDTRTGDSWVVDANKARLSRMRRRVRSWAGALSDVLSDGRRYRKVMITLTYRPGVDWEPGQIRAFMKRVRRSLGRGLVGYAWVAEMQRRGVVHYHVLLVVRRGVRIPKPDSAGWWSHGMTRIETARSLFYILTYTGKEYQKAGYPKGLRLFAVWVSKAAVTAAVYLSFRLSALPRWLADMVADAVQRLGVLPRRRSGGGWEFVDTVLRSPFRVRVVYV